MGKRGVVCDFAGEELHAGDLIVYATRQGNRVRLSEAVVKQVTAVREGGHIVPKLLVMPTGVESGFVARKVLRKQWVYAEHVRLITPQVVPESA